MPSKNKQERKEYDKNYRLRNPSKVKEIVKKSNKKWLLKMRHPCPVCGILIGRKAKTCRKHKPMPIGKEANNWKGGRINSYGGYVMLMKPEHPRADSRGYVYEHILVWEATHEKPVPSGWVIHHLNGIKADNRPQNLESMPSRKHSLILAAKAKRIKQLEAIIDQQGLLC